MSKTHRAQDGDRSKLTNVFSAVLGRVTQTPVHLTTVFILPCHLNQDTTKNNWNSFQLLPKIGSSVIEIVCLIEWYLILNVLVKEKQRWIRQVWCLRKTSPEEQKFRQVKINKPPFCFEISWVLALGIIIFQNHSYGTIFIILNVSVYTRTIWKDYIQKKSIRYMYRTVRPDW